MATVSRLNLTRDQLATFLNDHEQIRQFERLFALADSIAPDVVSEVSTAAGSAQATAVQAVGMALQTAQDAAVASAAAEAKAQVALDQIAALQADLGPSAAQLQTLLAALGVEVDGLQTLRNDVEALRTLRTEIEGLQMAPPLVPRKRTRYGQFYDTTVQQVGTINTAQAVTFNTTDISAGVRLRSPSTSEIEVDTEGLYNFQVSAQIDTTSGGTDLVYLWFRKNGVDIANSAFRVQIQGNNAELLQAFNLFIDLKAGDYVELMWAANDLGAELATFAATAFAPAIPSVILTVSNNIRGES